jgi:hypothetical protein
VVTLAVPGSLALVKVKDLSRVDIALVEVIEREAEGANDGRRGNEKGLEGDHGEAGKSRK